MEFFRNSKPITDANIVKLTNEVESVVNQLNDTTLKKEGLTLKWIYDQRPYIAGAVHLVKKDIIIGGALAVMILLLFLRALSPTAVVSLAIPISVIGTFILSLMNRSLNTVSILQVSLFSIGMLVDSAIVVLENIDRHRKMVRVSFKQRIREQKRFGVIFAGAATHMAVFIPIIF